MNRRTAIVLGLLIVALLGNPVPASASYPNVKITNLTNWSASGEVNYASVFCKNDKFTVQPGETWTGPGRGVCLITWISATLTGGPSVTKYTSSGTSYSEFFVTPSGSSYQIFSSHETPTTNRATYMPNSNFFNVGHMVNTTDAVDWALSQGANALEVDLQFDGDGTPSQFQHGAPCDCSCWMGGDDSVCIKLKQAGGCDAKTGTQALLNHIASKSSVAMLIIDSKLDDVTDPNMAGVKVVKLLVDELFSKDYKGFVLVSAPHWTYSGYIDAAASQASISQPYEKRIYVGIDQDNGNTVGARATLYHLWKEVPTTQVVYGSGVSVCSAATYYAETMLASWYTSQARVRLTNIWTLDKSDSMKEYIWLGARGILTNKPGALSKVTTDMGITLAKPGYLP